MRDEKFYRLVYKCCPENSRHDPYLDGNNASGWYLFDAILKSLETIKHNRGGFDHILLAQATDGINSKIEDIPLDKLEAYIKKQNEKLYGFSTGQMVYSKSLRLNLVVARKTRNDRYECINTIDLANREEVDKLTTHTVSKQDLTLGWR